MKWTVRSPTVLTLAKHANKTSNSLLFRRTLTSNPVPGVSTVIGCSAILDHISNEGHFCVIVVGFSELCVKSHLSCLSLFIQAQAIGSL